MKPKLPQLPKVVEAYVRAINNGDAASFIELFADDAEVEDIGRTFSGVTAITAWSDREIFGVQVTLEVIDCAANGDETVITSKVDGTFDRTGLPDPLIILHRIAVSGDKIVRLRCQLASEKSSPR
jgi:hypothetical protein